MTEKQKAWIVISIAGLIALVVLIASGTIILMAYPLLIALILFLFGMFFKWVMEWCVKNFKLFKIPERAKKVKKKLRVDEGVELVKKSIKTLKNDGKK